MNVLGSNQRVAAGSELATNFRLYRRGSLELYLQNGLGAYAGPLAERMLALRYQDDSSSRGRGGAFPVYLENAPKLFVRHSRRGGLVRMLARDLYFGPVPRPLTELKVSLEARRRGIPLAEPMGAMVEWAAPLVYRGAFITRAVEGMTLWEFIRTDDEPTVRSHVLDRARELIETMHQRGLYHADLNLHNLFVTHISESFALMLLDLDKARLYKSPLPASLRRANLARLKRSARKLDPSGQYLDRASLRRLNIE